MVALPSGLEGQEDLRKVLLNVIQNHELAEAEKRELAEKNDALNDLIVKHEKRHEALKMQIRFKESHIARLRKDAPSEASDETMAQLREEIALLQKQVQHHPDAKRFSLESRDLRAELKQVKAMYDVEGHNLTLQALRARMLELEQCLRDQLVTALSAGTPGTGMGVKVRGGRWWGRKGWSEVKTVARREVLQSSPFFFSVSFSFSPHPPLWRTRDGGPAH